MRIDGATVLEATEGVLYANRKPIVGGVQVATVTLSAAQILSLSPNVGVQLIPGPGMGKMLVPLTIATQMKFVTTPYTIPNANDFLAFGYGPPLTLGAQVFSQSAQDLQSASSVLAILGFNGSTGPFNAATHTSEQNDLGDFPITLENAPFHVWYNNGLGNSPTLGDSILTVATYYMVVTLQ